MNNSSQKILAALLLIVAACVSPAFAADSVSESSQAAAQSKITITGSVVDEDGGPIPGVVVYIKGDQSTGVLSNELGEFSIKVPGEESVLVFTVLGFKTKEIPVGDKRIMSIILDTEAQMMDDAIVIGFAKQRKESVVAAVTSVKPAQLKGPTSNLTTMIGSQVAGMISYQKSGEPGADNAEFFIRGVGSFGAGKVDPLILIDGIESSNTDLARLQPDDISDFSVLKDATAAAVYGARGANGVILVNTKGGMEGKTKFTFRAENSLSTNTQNFQLADNITFMELSNEAVLTRNPAGLLMYSKDKIANTKNNVDPILYPNNDWIDMLIKPYTMNQRFNMSLSGGGRVARYYIAGTFNIDNGVLRDDPYNNFKNNVSLKNYSIRSNTDINLTKTTVATIRMYAQFDDYSGPIGGGSSIFSSAMKANPVAFPAFYPKSMDPSKKHIMFGSALMYQSTSSLYRNPYAQMVSGYQMYNTSTINAQIEFNQDFGFLLKGLSARLMGYTQRYAHFSTSRQYNPYYYYAHQNNSGVVNLFQWNHGSNGTVGVTGTEYLNYNSGGKSVSSTFYGEAVVNYDNSFAKKHNVTGMLLGTIRQHIEGGAGSLEQSLPFRNISLAGRFTYDYDKRYLFEFDFGYNGSERFSARKRWGFFPSVAGGWIVSNEKFYGEGLKNVLSNLKLRASYGLIGNDQIGSSSDRFFYLSEVSLNDWGDRRYTFGENFAHTIPGMFIKRYGNEDIGWELSEQINLGLDFNLLGVNVIAEAYKQYRSNILLTRSHTPPSMGLQIPVSANTGKVETQGVDISAEYNKSFNNSWYTTMRANFTYATNKITSYDEPQYGEKEYYRSRVGYPINQAWGFVADRLFVDDAEVENSPVQKFDNIEVVAGDIKYRDVNGDGVITGSDQVPIGAPTTPEINYGFGGTIGWKGFDFSFYFQGTGRYSIFIKPDSIEPFVMDYGSSVQHGLLKVIADNHWSEDNRNLYAFWPRLSDKHNSNNCQPSTWWMRSGNMLRLKSLEIGYNLPDKALSKIKLESLRFYLNASNLFNISTFDLWDPEMGGNGLGYPIQRVFNIGLQIAL